jgi:hypothetical protein
MTDVATSTETLSITLVQKKYSLTMAYTINTSPKYYVPNVSILLIFTTLSFLPILHHCFPLHHCFLHFMPLLFSPLPSTKARPVSISPSPVFPTPPNCLSLLKDPRLQNTSRTSKGVYQSEFILPLDRLFKKNSKSRRPPSQALLLLVSSKDVR